MIDRDLLPGSPLSEMEVIQSALLASERSAAIVHEDLRQGLSSLATIASIAPWLGVFATVWGIVDSFGPIWQDKATGLGIVANRLSIAIWPTALGLLVAVTARCFDLYLTGRLESFDREMGSAAIELGDHLKSCLGGFNRIRARNGFGDKSIFGDKYLTELLEDSKWQHRYGFLTGAVLAGAWFVQFLRYVLQASLPFQPAARAACCYVLLVLFFCCLPAWVMRCRLSRRRPGELMFLGSLLCLCWCVAEFVLRVHLL